MSDGGVLIGIAGIAILVAYYALAASWLVRRRHVPVPPAPDETLLPADVRYLYRGRFDGRTLLAAILGLVAKGALSLKRRPNGTSYIEPALDPADARMLAADERALGMALFRTGNRMVDLTDAREPALEDAAIALRNGLHRRFINSPRLSRRALIGLLLGGGLLASLSLILTAWVAGSVDHGAARTALMVAFYILGLIATVSCILFVQQFRDVNLVLKLVIVFTVLSCLPIMLVLIAGGLLDHFNRFGAIGSAPFVLPLLGSWLLLWRAKPRFDVSAEATAQVSGLYDRLRAADTPMQFAGGAQGSGDSGPIDSLLPFAVALDAGDDAIGRLGPVFDELSIGSGRISLFAAPKAAAADLTAIGQIAMR